MAGSNTFISWLRRGLATQIIRKDGTLPLDPLKPEPRARIQVNIELNEGLTARAEPFLYGPGEVSGLDARAVIRTWPRPGVYDAASNFFPLIEFSQPDLPWRYTPARATDDNKLRPWFCLIVLEENEFDRTLTPDGHHPLPAIKVKGKPSPLPNPEQTWAWAHVQVSGSSLVTNAAEVLNLLKSEPDRVVSRLLCPRRLKPRTSYTGFLVPTFERGRLAGLGEAVPDNVDALETAWTLDKKEIELPVYYEWSFMSGAELGFEEMVRQLKKGVPSPEAGKRDMDVSNPGVELPGAASRPLGMPGALMTAIPWDPNDRDNFVIALNKLVAMAEKVPSVSPKNLVSRRQWQIWQNGLDRLIRVELNVPPAETSGWDPVAQTAWIKELQRLLDIVVKASRGEVPQWQDRRARWIKDITALAGAGRLVAEAARFEWEPAERREWIKKLKGLLDTPLKLLSSSGLTGRLTPPLYGRWHAGHVDLQPPPSLGDNWSWFDELNSNPRLRVAAALGVAIVRDQQAQLMASAWQQVEGIRALNTELRQAQMAREMALRIYLSQIQDQEMEAMLQFTTPLYGRVLEGNWTIRHWLEASRIPPGVLTPQWRRQARPYGPIGRRQRRDTRPAPSSVLQRLNDGKLQLAGPPDPPSEMVKLDFTDFPQGFDPIKAEGGGPDFTVFEGPESPAEWPPKLKPDPAKGKDNVAGEKFREAMGKVWKEVTAIPSDLPLPAVDLGILQARLKKDLNPEVTITAGYIGNWGRLDTTRLPDWHPADPLEPVLAAPRFSQAMMKPLRDLSQEWLFPGLDKVTPNSVCLLEVNRSFINAYMVGLNHEMARELRWNEYPTDQRGTYFRQFWDPAAYHPQPVDPTVLEDIDAIDRWPLTAPLEKAGKKSNISANPLVLLLRGDLLARYPTLLLYATPGEPETDSKSKTGRQPIIPVDDVDDPQKYPVFSDTLKPDVTFFAFDLTTDDVLGKSQAYRQGWYFIFQEQPSEPRHGLNASLEGGTVAELNTWDDLEWAHLPGPVNFGDYIDLEKNAPESPKNVNVTWGNRSADMALLTLQRQVRVAIHGSDLIEPGKE